MSASGKTTIAVEMIRYLKKYRSSGPWVLVDGDTIRNIMGEDLGHSIEDRKRNADRICNLCYFLDSQGINIIVCILSIFHESQDWMRKNISDYRQLYLRVDYGILKKRDNKRLYELAEKGEIDNVVGVQISFPEPKDSDCILDNNKDGVHLADLALKALEGLGLSYDISYEYSEGNLLEEPITYQYTTFEGKGFFKAYRKSREKALDRLAFRLHAFTKATKTICPDVPDGMKRLSQMLLKPVEDELGNNDTIYKKFLSCELMPDDYMDRFLPGRNLDKHFITREFFINELRRMESGDWCFKESKEQIFALIQRFEVSKKIFDYYSLPDIRKVDSSFSDLLNFPLFHVLLTFSQQYAYERAGLIIQNAVLKLGDTIVSAINEFITPGQMVLVYSSLRNELELMSKKYDV